MKFMPLILTYTLAMMPIIHVGHAKAASIPIDVEQTNKAPTIKVLLHEKEPSFLLEVKGPYKLFCPHSNVLLASSHSPKRAKMQPNEKGLNWGELIPGNHAVRIVPSDNRTSIFVNGIQYKGCLEIYDLGGSLRAVNEVDIENYLKSCLANATFHVDEVEALHALAIVLRSQTYYQISQAFQAPWHTTKEESCYRGHALTMQNLPLEKALTATSHAILTYQSHPFALDWTENSAGVTASFAAIHRQNIPTPGGVTIQGMESERSKSAWSFQIAKSQLAKIAHLVHISAITPFAEKRSGKVYAIRLDDQGNTATIDFFTLQNAMGKTKLKSNDFSVEILEDSVRFKGYGEGSGVGLCLHSAQLMAKKGMDAKAILMKFFPDAELMKIERFAFPL